MHGNIISNSNTLTLNLGIMLFLDLEKSWKLVQFKKKFLKQICILSELSENRFGKPLGRIFKCTF